MADDWRSTAFLVNNPLQLLFSVSLARQLGVVPESQLVICGVFTGARQVFDRLIAADAMGGFSIVYCGNRRSALAHIKKSGAQHLFVDSDASFRNFVTFSSLKMRRRELTLNVYEEGLGTYRDDLYTGLKRRIFEMVGVGVYMGGFPKTDAVFVLEPEKYRSVFPKFTKALHKIDAGPFDTLMADIEFWKDIFDYRGVPETSAPSCSVYLSAWEWSPQRIAPFLSSPGDKYIKLHPRFQGDVEMPALSIGGSAPAEMVLADLASKYEQVAVYHHGSSVEWYAKADNIHYVRS